MSYIENTNINAYQYHPYCQIYEGVAGIFWQYVIVEGFHIYDIHIQEAGAIEAFQYCMIL